MPEALFQISEPGQSPEKAACPPGMTRAIGIDLGTTNSLVAIVREGGPRALPDEEGDPCCPRSFTTRRMAAPRWSAAAPATCWRPCFPGRPSSSVKRFMGRGPDDAEAQRRLTPYEFAPAAEHGQDNEQDKGKSGVVRFAVAGGTPRRHPGGGLGRDLARVEGRAERALGGPLDGAVITVPAYFDDGQRQATRDAGRMAGLEVLRLLNEPTAAALAYGLDKQVEGTFAVFDLGGGTFDMSILKLDGGVFEVKVHRRRLRAGRRRLRPGDRRTSAGRGRPGRADAGGDHALARPRAGRRPRRQGSADGRGRRPRRTGEARRRARRLFCCRVPRCETLVRPVLERCAGPVRRALKDAGLGPADLSGVILVGGATRMPLVRRFVADLFGRRPLADIDPDQVVALGAAVQADLLAGGAAAATWCCWTWSRCRWGWR